MFDNQDTLSDGFDAVASEDTLPEHSMLTAVAVIGASISIKGEVSAAESLIVQGVVEGDINIRDHDLIIGSTGRVMGNVAAKEIRVEGLVDGDLHGSEKITIAKDSHVCGNLVTRRINLEDGAMFKGTIDMDPAPQASFDFDEQSLALAGQPAPMLDEEPAESVFADTIADATLADDDEESHFDASPLDESQQEAAEESQPVGQFYTSNSVPSPLFDSVAEPYGNGGESTAEEAKQALQEVRRQFAASAV